MPTNQQPQPQPTQPIQQQPVYPMTNPGQTMGIIGLVGNFLGFSVVGIILGALSMNESKKAGMSSALGIISLIWGILGILLAVLLFILFFAGVFALPFLADYSY